MVEIEGGITMKYKLLLTGTNQILLNDFFNHMDFSFECMGSTQRGDDILCHLKYFQPDALIFCLYKENKQDLCGLGGVVRKLSAEEIPLIIVGESEACALFGKTLPMAADLVIKKPFTTKGLEEKILAYLDNCAREKERKRERIEKLVREAEEEEYAVPVEKKESEQELMDTLAFIDRVADEMEKKKHILIVDDDSSVLKLVKGYLGKQYHVATAISGKVALKFLEKKETDLILLDYEMPEENGAQVLEKIRSNEKTKNLPVVFLTGVTEREKIQDVLALNPQGYLLKPISMERLSATLKDIFEA